MQIIPLIAVPSQTLQIQLDGQNAQINVYAMNLPIGAGLTADTTDVTADTTDVTADSSGSSVAAGAALYFDLLENGVPIITGRLVRNLIPMLLSSGYMGFEGNFTFVDTQATGLQDGTDPTWPGLGSRYQLIYLEPQDLS